MPTTDSILSQLITYRDGLLEQRGPDAFSGDHPIIWGRVWLDDGDVVEALDYSGNHALSVASIDSDDELRAVADMLLADEVSR